MNQSPRAVLTDIEGTTTPIAFVRQVLFPYARVALPRLLRERAHDPQVAGALAQIRGLAPEADPLAQCLAWMDRDAKITPLKLLQGLVWQDGYAAGALRSELYPDVAPALRAWHAAGVRLAAYSSGSEAAQRLIFGYPPAGAGGDLSRLFSAFLDTRIGAKSEAGSYREAARRLGLPPASILFLSDSVAELDAADTAGLACCRLLRAEDAMPDAAADRTRYLGCRDFEAVATRFGLPGGGAS